LAIRLYIQMAQTKAWKFDEDGECIAAVRWLAMRWRWGWWGWAEPKQQTRRVGRDGQVAWPLSSFGLRILCSTRRTNLARRTAKKEVDSG